MITAPFSSKGTEMSGVSTSSPAMSSPTAAAAISQAVTLSGWISSVRSMEVPPVEMLAVARRYDRLPRGGNGVERAAAAGQDRSVCSSRGRDRVWTGCGRVAARVAVDLFRQRADGARPVPHHVRGHALRHGHHACR